MLSPVLCMLLFKNLKPVPDNFFVRFIKYSYLRPLGVCLKHRWLTVLFFATLFACTACLLPSLGANSCRNWRRATSGFGTPAR